MVSDCSGGAPRCAHVDTRRARARADIGTWTDAAHSATATFLSARSAGRMSLDPNALPALGPDCSPAICARGGSACAVHGVRTAAHITATVARRTADQPASLMPRAEGMAVLEPMRQRCVARERGAESPAATPRTMRTTHRGHREPRPRDITGIARPRAQVAIVISAMRRHMEHRRARHEVSPASPERLVDRHRGGRFLAPGRVADVASVEHLQSCRSMPDGPTRGAAILRALLRRLDAWLVRPARASALRSWRALSRDGRDVTGSRSHRVLQPRSAARTSARRSVRDLAMFCSASGGTGVDGLSHPKTGPRSRSRTLPGVAERVSASARASDRRARTQPSRNAAEGVRRSRSPRDIPRRARWRRRRSSGRRCGRSLHAVRAPLAADPRAVARQHPARRCRVTLAHCGDAPTHTGVTSANREVTAKSASINDGGKPESATCPTECGGSRGSNRRSGMPDADRGIARRRQASARPTTSRSHASSNARSFQAL